MIIFFGMIFGSLIFLVWTLPNEPTTNYHAKCYDKYGSVINDLECTSDSLYFPLNQKIFASIIILFFYGIMMYQTYCEDGI
jgi:hypothetical protein